MIGSGALIRLSRWIVWSHTLAFMWQRLPQSAIAAGRSNMHAQRSRYTTTMTKRTRQSHQKAGASFASQLLCFACVNYVALGNIPEIDHRPPQPHQRRRKTESPLQMSSLRKGKNNANVSSPSSSKALAPSAPLTRSPSANTRTQTRSTKKSTSTQRTKHYNATWSNDMDTMHQHEEEEHNPNSAQFIKKSPFPMMPSPLLINLAQSQFELLSNSLVHTFADFEIASSNNAIKPGTLKINSMALYLPKENENTGQLEFVPAVTYPNPTSERVFIASDSSSSSFNDGIHEQYQQPYPPTIPSTAVKENPTKRLPGFAKAKDLIPSYPFVSSSESDSDYEDGGQEAPSSSIGVSAVEEISTGFSTEESGPKALSVTLFSGMETIGVLMIWPYKGRTQHHQQLSMDGKNQTRDDYCKIHTINNNLNQWKWTPSDKLQVSRTAKSIALALSMDNERTSTQIQSEQFRVALADSLHQVKSPLQALRTFGKLLQRQLAEEHVGGMRGKTPSNGASTTRPTMERVPISSNPSYNNDSSWGRRQRQALKLAEDMMAQGERVVDLIEPMDTLVQNGGKYSLNGRYLLNPQESSSKSGALILLPSDKNGNNNQRGMLPYSSSNLEHSAQQHGTQIPTPLIGDFNVMTFPQDILGPIVYASQAISLELGINFDAVGFEPDAELPGVSVCPKLLQEAISNLLDNAIKYAPLGRNSADVGSERGSTNPTEGASKGNRRRDTRRRKNTPQIKVTLSSNEPPLSAGATLCIEDNGPGIPESEWDSVFQRGYRSETAQDVPGSGLGLGISKEIITRMGGVLDILEEGPAQLGGTAIRVIVFRDPEM